MASLSAPTGKYGRCGSIISLAFSGIALALSIYVYCAYDRAHGGLQFVERAAWLPGLGISYFLGVNGINVTLLEAMASRAGGEVFNNQ